MDEQREFRGGYAVDASAGTTAALLFALAVMAAVAVARGLLDQPASLADPWIWLGLAPAVALAAGWRGARRVWTALWLLFGALALANLVLGLVPIRHYGDWQELQQLILDPSLRSSGRWLGGLEVLTHLYEATVALGAGEGLATATLVIRTVAILATVGASLALLRRWPRRLCVILPTLTPIWLLFAAGHTEYYPSMAWALVLALAWATAEPLASRPAWQVGLLVALLHPFLYLGFAPIAALLFAAYLVTAPRRAAVAGLIAAVAAVATVQLFWDRGLLDFASRVYLHTGATWDATLFKPYEGHGAAPDSIYFTWSYAASPEHLLDLFLMQSMGGGLLALPLLAAGLVLALREQAARRSLATVGGGFVFAVGGWQLLHALRYHAQRGPVDDVDVHFATYLTLAFLAGLLFDAWLDAGGETRRRWAPRVIAIWLAGAATAAATLLVHGVELPRARWGAEEFATALQRERDPELVDRLLDRLDGGQLLTRSIGGNAAAVALGLQYDHWTYGNRPAALVLHNTGSLPARPRLELHCWAPAEYLPVVALLDDGSGAPAEVVFAAGGARRIERPAIPAGERRVLSVWTDRGWPGAERRPRWLGVRVVAVDWVEALEAGAASARDP